MMTLEEYQAELDRQAAQGWWIRWPRRVGEWARYRMPKYPQRSRQAVGLARQRITRGWDDASVWGLDHWLGRTLGAQLVYMADIAHGWPGSYDGGFDAWVADLRMHGEALKHYARANDDLPHHLSLSRAGEEEIHRHAQIAMHWVADNFGALWD